MTSKHVLPLNQVKSKTITEVLFNGHIPEFECPKCESDSFSRDADNGTIRCLECGWVGPEWRACDYFTNLRSMEHVKLRLSQLVGHGVRTLVHFNEPAICDVDGRDATTVGAPSELEAVAEAAFRYCKRHR